MKVLIVEDEPTAAKRLQKMLAEIDSAIEVQQNLDSIEASVIWMADKSKPAPDLIFMDIHLADGPCFEIFKLVEVNQPVIFTTAYDQYAIEAFKVNAIDYLMKPVKQAELMQAVEKYKKLHRAPAMDYEKLAIALRQEADQYNKRFLIRFGQSIRVVELSEVAYFFTEDKITFLTLQSGKRYPIDYSLEKLEEMVNPAKFFRINRQFIVNIEAIQEMYAYSKSRVKVNLHPSTERETIVSTERSPHFKKWLTGTDENMEEQS